MLCEWSTITKSNMVDSHHVKIVMTSQCDLRFDLCFSFSFSFASYFLVLVSFQFYQTC